ncbi:MAG TPA: c-type cytochrome [Terriglobales bacterium]|jgi:mono/diheme cytochrome c family protein
MRTRSLPVFFCFLLVGLASLAVAQRSSFHDAPAPAASLRNPLATTPAAIDAGRAVFLSRCSACHGVKGEGVGNAARLNSGPAQAATPGEIFWFITKGEPEKNMPSWSVLPAEQRWQLVAYLKSLGKHRGTRKVAN